MKFTIDKKGPMKRLATFLKFAFFAIVLLPFIERECGAQEGPVLRLLRPDSIVAYAQPVIYAVWWQEIAECEGLDLPPQLARLVKFYEVKAQNFIPVGEQADLGATFPREMQIFLASPYVWNPKLVKHEMLHILLWVNGLNFGPYHPAEFFDVCGLAPWGS